MQKRVKKPKSGFAIAVIHPDGTKGFLAAKDGSVETYATKISAQAAMEEKKKDKRYTWSLPMEVQKYDERDEVIDE